MPAPLTVLSGGSAEVVMDIVAARFEKETGQPVKITYNLDENVSRRVEEGEAFDLILASANSMKKNYLAKGLIEEGGIGIGSYATGVAVRKGAPVPDISSMEALRRAVLEADAVLITNHTSGYYIADRLRDMGVHDQIKAKFRYFPNGPELLEGLANGSGREIGFLSTIMIATCKDRLVLAGLLPAEIALVREYQLAPTRSSPRKELAWAFARYCAGPCRPLFLEKGFI